MMPIQSFSSFQRMTQFCKTKVPEQIWADLAAMKDDDEAVKAYGVKLCTDMCRVLSSAGVPGFHFYTLNLEKSVLGVLKEFGIDETLAARRYYA
jgi:methylenetetrahydrofolate reductase (NADPH)